MADAEAVRVVCTSHLRRDLCACFLLKIRFVVSVERQSTVMYPESVSCAGETVSERPGCDSRRLRTHSTKSHVGAPVAGRDPSPGCRVHSEPYSVFGFVDRDVCQRWLKHPVSPQCRSSPFTCSILMASRAFLCLVSVSGDLVSISEWMLWFIDR